MTSIRRVESLQIRRARPSDVEGITTLIDRFASQGIMLAKTTDAITLALDDFVVARDARGRVVACGALREYSPSVAEVASVAVSEEAQGRGVGTRIVLAVEQLATVRGIQELFALTLTPGFFAAAGYSVVDRTTYPEKIRRDCRGCARRFACTEICVQRLLTSPARIAVAA